MKRVSPLPPPTSQSPPKKVKVEEARVSKATGAVWTIDRTKGTVAQTAAPLVKKVEETTVYMKPTTLVSLFPPNLLRRCKTIDAFEPCLFQTRSGSSASNAEGVEDFETTISKAAQACFMTIAQRKQYSNVVQDDFKRKEKTTRLEMQRPTYRLASMFFFPCPLCIALILFASLHYIMDSLPS